MIVRCFFVLLFGVFSCSSENFSIKEAEVVITLELRYNAEESCESRYQIEEISEVDFFGCVPFEINYVFEAGRIKLCFESLSIVEVVDFRYYDETTDIEDFSISDNCIEAIVTNQASAGFWTNVILSN